MSCAEFTFLYVTKENSMWHAHPPVWKYLRPLWIIRANRRTGMFGDVSITHLFNSTVITVELIQHLTASMKRECYSPKRLMIVYIDTCVEMTCVCVCVMCTRSTTRGIICWSMKSRPSTCRLSLPPTSSSATSLRPQTSCPSRWRSPPWVSIRISSQISPRVLLHRIILSHWPRE